MNEKVYVVVQDGFPNGYGADMYLIGVFDRKEDADAVAGRRNEPNFREIIEIEKNSEFPLMPVFLGRDIFNYKNDYYIGGRVE